MRVLKTSDLIKISNILNVDFSLLKDVFVGDSRLVRLVSNELLAIGDSSSLLSCSTISGYHIDLVHKNLQSKSRKQKFLMDRSSLLIVERERGMKISTVFDLEENHSIVNRINFKDDLEVSNTDGLFVSDITSALKSSKYLYTVSEVISRYLTKDWLIGHQRSDWYCFGTSCSGEPWDALPYNVQSKIKKEYLHVLSGIEHDYIIVVHRNYSNN